MKIHEYEQGTISPDSSLIFDGVNTGTKRIQAANLAKKLREFNRATNEYDGFEELDSWIPFVLRKNIYRGANLGNTYTLAQQQNLMHRSYKGFFIGDYWTINGIKWRIADMDYWNNTGDSPTVSIPHLIIVPDTSLYSEKMNSTNTTVGGYIGSDMYTGGLESAKNMINSAFGSYNILSRREYLCNAVSNGYQSGAAWYDSIVELMNEILVYGCYIMNPAGTGSVTPKRQTVGGSQLALFRLASSWIQPNRSNYWLRDVANDSQFVCVRDSSQSSSGQNASDSIGVRPVFGLTADSDIPMPEDF